MRFDTDWILHKISDGPPWIILLITIRGTIIENDFTEIELGARGYPLMYSKIYYNQMIH